LKNSIDADVTEIDESNSQSLQLKLSSDSDLKALRLIRAKFEEIKDESSIGKINLNWFIQDLQLISQFNISWFIAEGAVTQRKSVDGNTTSCIIPVNKLKYFN
jgi:hypothetical protein